MCTNTSAPVGDKGNWLQPELAYQFAELFYSQICLLIKKKSIFSWNLEAENGRQMALHMNCTGQEGTSAWKCGKGHSFLLES